MFKSRSVVVPVLITGNLSPEGVEGMVTLVFDAGRPTGDQLLGFSQAVLMAPVQV
jgi:hypothetical protein